MRTSPFFCVLVGVLSMLCLVGCKETGSASTIEVSGVVRHNGSPVADASVTFTPEKGRPANGVTDASGRFVLSTFAEGDGAVPGPHKVSISPNASQIPPMPGTPEAAQAAAGKPPFPARYSNPEQSGFTAQVEEGKPNEFEFDMTD